MEYENKMLKCIDCGKEFAFTGEEQEFFASKKFVEPKRCKPCRQIKKQKKRGYDREI